MPYFSIIIPALNEEKYLPKLLQDLTHQTYSDFEIVVVDGKSDDSTVKTATTFKDKLPLTIVSSPKRNVSHQRNLGASHTTGKVLVFFDADTRIPKPFLAKINHLMETKKPHMLTTYFKPDSTKATDKTFAILINASFDLGRLVGFPACYGAMQVIKRGVFEDIGGYDEHVSFGEDSHLFLKGVRANYKYMIYPHPRYTYSLRRFRSEGMLDSLYKYLKIDISVIVNGYYGKHPEYQMGGHVFKTDKLTVDPAYKRFSELFAKVKLLNQAQLKSFVNKVSKFIPPEI